ncbi:MAG: alpha/beta hydrolase [Erythrobacter sp.]
MTLALKALAGLVALYALLIALLFVAQSRLIYPAPQIRHDPAPGFEAVQLETSDGLLLTGHWRAPDPDRATVLWFHGNAGSLAGAARETRVLAEAGYGIMLAPYRGYAAEEGHPSEAGFARDGRAALAFIRKAGVAPQQLIVAGNSIGTGTAVAMASEAQPAALILVSPLTSLADVAGGALPFVPARSLLRDRYDNAARIAALDLPILVLHGTADRVVPVSHGRTLSGLNDRADFTAFEGAGHDLSFHEETQRVQRDWLAKQGL